MRNIFWMVVLLLLACNQQQQSNVSWSYFDGSTNKISDFDKYSATVLTFMSPECPLSENYTKTLNELEATFKIENVRFINVFPGKLYSRVKIDSFMQTYQVKQAVIFDEQLSLVNQLSASITPESFIVDKNGEVVYSGAIDNWAVDLGQKRQVITEFYVRDVLYALLSGSKIPYHKTTAIGCYIEMQHQH